MPAQIKEKFGTLRLYYGYLDAPCRIAAFDNLATGDSIRFEFKSEGEIDDAKAKLRQDIRTMQEWELGRRAMPEYVLRLIAYKVMNELREGRIG